MAQTPENDKLQQIELTRRAVLGDEGAFAQLYDLYFDKVYRFIYYRVSHQETAEDLTAETFIRCWKRIGKITDIKAFNGWVHQIARNLVIDHYRSRKQTADLEPLENILEYEDTGLQKTDLDLGHQKILEATKTLSHDQQQVIRLKFLEDLDNDEIAKILDKSEGAIRVIQHRAITELKKILDNNDF